MIILPTSPQPSNVQPSLNDFGGFNEPPLGGAVQRIERMGNRFSAVVTMPAMSATNVRAWITDLLRGKSEGVRIRFPQLGVVVGAPRLPVVDGANQAGLVLNVRGCSPHYAFVKGQWINIVTANFTYLHNVTANVSASAGGLVALPIYPMIRDEALADGAAIEVANPVIEGWIRGEEWQWEVPVDAITVLQFTVEERK